MRRMPLRRRQDGQSSVAKRKRFIYEPGKRSGSWLKFKLNSSQQFVFGGFTVANPFDALIVCCYEGGKLRYVGRYERNSSRTCAVGSIAR
jgi:bifunctional non-homologous end joining protein LigD